MLICILRQMDFCKTTPILFLIGNASMENVKKAMKSGGNGFIKKPVEYDTLIAKIGKYLNGL